MNYADRYFQRDLVHSMAKALAHGLITESEFEVRRWAKRCEQIADFAVTIYGEHTTRALLDQARAAARSDCHHASPLLGGVSLFGDKAKRVGCQAHAMRQHGQRLSRPEAR